MNPWFSLQIFVAVVNFPEKLFSLLDLLQKSFMEIGDGRDEVESKPKAFSSVSVSAAQNAKAFECSQDVFDANAA